MARPSFSTRKHGGLRGSGCPYSASRLSRSSTSTVSLHDLVEDDKEDPFRPLPRS